MGPLVALAKLQNVMGGAPVPALAQWRAHHLGPVLGAIHNRNRRERMETELNRLTGEGVLTPIAQLLGNTHAQTEDRRGFQAAQRRYCELAGERARAERELAHVTHVATQQSGPIAVTAAFAIALMSLVIVGGLG